MCKNSILLVVVYSNLIIMKIFTTQPHSGDFKSPMSKTSRFVRFLVMICFFPISVKNNKLYFEWISCRSILYLIYSIVRVVIEFSLYGYFFPEDFLGLFEERIITVKLKNWFLKIQLELGPFCVQGQ